MNACGWCGGGYLFLCYGPRVSISASAAARVSIMMSPPCPTSSIANSACMQLESRLLPGNVAAAWFNSLPSDQGGYEVVPHAAYVAIARAGAFET